MASNIYIIGQLGAFVHWRKQSLNEIHDNEVCPFGRVRPQGWDRFVIKQNLPPDTVRLQISSCSLIDFVRFKQGLEVAFAKAASALALNHFEEKRGAVLHRFGEDLKQVAL
jgi:hypothetical protein